MMSGEPNVDGKPVEYKQISNEMQRLLDRSADFTARDDRKLVVNPIDGYAKPFVPIKPIVIPGMEVTPVKPQGGLDPRARSFDAAFGETEDDGGPEVASDTDYEAIFAQRGDFSDSFDFAYDGYGNIIGAVRPQGDADAEREREEVAGRYAESQMREIEKRIGSPIEQADTSYLHNDETLIGKVKRIVVPQKRRVIHDGD